MKYLLVALILFSTSLYSKEYRVTINDVICHKKIVNGGEQKEWLDDICEVVTQYYFHNYLIISSESTNDLAWAITTICSDHRLRRKWQPQGGVSPCYRCGGYDVIYYQAIYTKETHE
jgi:hypothetical protein